MSIVDYFRVYRRSRVVETLARIPGLRFAPIIAIHLAALTRLYLTEFDLLGQTLFVLAWLLLNCVWLALLRRPAISAALSLVMVEVIVALSKFKYDVTWMTASFMDILIVDSDTVAFLLRIFPDLRTNLVIAALLGIPALIALWRLDPFRVRLRTALIAAMVCLAGLAGLSRAFPERPWEPFQGVNHFSNFARSGMLSVSTLMSSGWLDADPRTGSPISTAKAAALPVEKPACEPAGRRPHIIMVLDESSIDVSSLPGIKVPPDYSRHFRSFDGKTRSLLTEAAGGPTWYTEYNVLTGLSARSFGRLMFYVTRIAAGRVERGLPQSLRHCGYKTFTLYPAYGAFMSARNFQHSAGIGRMIDSQEMGAGDVEPDHFYYDKAAKLIEREGTASPLFIFVYTVANHFPWNTSFRPDLTPGWKNPGNDPEVDEYIRRQTMSAKDYSDFTAQLKKQYPGEPFLIVRFGDHPPTLGARLIDPSLDDREVSRRIMDLDPRYYMAYYAIDAINFSPVDTSSALDTLDAPYLPLMIQQAAGLPLDASFSEQKKIFERCDGMFYRCRKGAEARRFNRMLIDSGLIKGL